MDNVRLQDGSTVTVLDRSDRGMACLAPPAGRDDRTELGFSFKKFIARNANSLGTVLQVAQVAAPILTVSGVGTGFGLALGAISTAAKTALAQVAPAPAGVEADPETGVAVGSTVVIAPPGAGLPAGLSLPDATSQALGDGRTAWIIPPGKPVPSSWPQGTQVHRTAKGSNLVTLPAPSASPPTASGPAKPAAVKAALGGGAVIAVVVVVGLIALSRSKRR